MKSLETFTQELGASSAAVMEVDNTADHLFCRESFNMPDAWVTIKNPLDASTINGKVYVTNLPVIANDINLELQGYHIDSVLVVPIGRDGATIGTVELVMTDDSKTFTEEDKLQAEAFAAELEPNLT